MKTKYETRVTNHESRMRAGAVLILAVVLTSLLAVVGVMFVMTAQVDRTATSAISENRELNFAIETVIADISQNLVSDVPGIQGQEYYDYPGPEDPWLASLEPGVNDNGTPNDINDDIYYWRHISDVYEKLGVGLRLEAEIIPDYQESVNKGFIADADGDGVADAKWIKLGDITSNKGKSIYAAVRIIDNGGMLNVNTAYKFDPTEPIGRIDGSSQLQINLAALSQRGANGSLAQAADDLQALRRGTEPIDLSQYEQNVVWRYNAPVGAYTPFDISDELELRNRFLLDQHYIKARIEDKDKLWSDAFWGTYYLWTPVDGSGGIGLEDWFYKAQNDVQDLDAVEPDKDYSYRHISTTYNMDRIINPNGDKMVNVNTDSLDLIRQAILEGIDESEPGREAVAAQMAVNIKDFRDNDSNVTVYPNPDDGKIYYGFETPCIYISELAHKFVAPDISPIPVELIHRSYAIELFKPYPEDDYPDATQWRLVIPGALTRTEYIDWSGTNHFHVIVFEDPCAPLDLPADFPYTKILLPGPGNVVFSAGKIISLERSVGTDWISVDSVEVPQASETSGWLVATDGVARSIERDITLHKCIRRLWYDSSLLPTLGGHNPQVPTDSIYIQAHPYLDPDIYENRGFKNIGEIGMVFRKAAYYNPSIGQTSSGKIGYPAGPTDPPETKTEDGVRINLADPRYQNIFKYLTVWPPSYVSDPNEKRIKGRININTAPWYVIAQLPWVSAHTPNYELAQAIVAYRDKTSVSDSPDYGDRSGKPGFRSIGELNNIVEGSSGYRIDYYACDSHDLETYPDLTPKDGARPGSPEYAIDDFEERDIIFHRISNLVTVRSDVFTAYILVRIGSDGPQKRVIAILDRSSVYSPIDKVKIVALHPVPDPR